MSFGLSFSSAQVVATIAAAALVSAADSAIEQFSRPAGPAETKLTEALNEGKQLAAAGRLDAYQRVARDVLELRPNNVEVKQALTSALSEVKVLTSTDQAAATLEAALGAAQATLAFRPLMEAPLPDGFPPPTPLGEIEIKAYPAYRMARTIMDGQAGEGRAFLTLFAHITTSNIAMTAPVETTYSGDKRSNTTAESMAFLYQNPKIGELGGQDRVRVVDVPAMTVVSLALRGGYTSERVSDAEAKLRSWLQQYREYEPAGSLRLMGYNSPMVPPERRFAELQLPVKKRSSR